MSSDHIGDSASYKLEAASADLSPDIPVANWGFDNIVFDITPSGTFRGPKNGDSLSKVVVEARVGCEDDNVLNWSEARGDITGIITYTVDVPTYEPGGGFSLNEDW